MKKTSRDMRHASLDQFLSNAGPALASGPVALVFVEDLVEVESTLRHHASLGFRAVVALGPKPLEAPAGLEEVVHLVPWDMSRDAATETAVNRMIAAFPGAWFYYCYNAEYLFYPFCEHRSVGEMLAFHAEERRDAMLTYVIDLYASDLGRHPDAVSLEDAYLDRLGYFALARPDPTREGKVKERQLDFFGGLRWRFEEHIPKKRRRIDRIGLFRAKKGLRLREDHTFTDEEYNTYACPWHHNLTAAICSFRTAKALRTNAGSRFGIDTMHWHNSARFTWHSRQLLDLGLMEPGQWF